MSDWWAHAGNKMKFFASLLSVLVILGGWFWSVFVVADTATDAKQIAISADSKAEKNEKKISDVAYTAKDAKEIALNADNKATQNEKEIITIKSDTSYTKKAVDEIKKNLEKQLEAQRRQDELLQRIYNNSLE